MFEIGSTLRDARVRRGISLQQAEDDTKIRVKYIQAMENEDFDVLPGGTYVKGFLRTYSDYLDLDYQIVLDEFNERFGSGDHREHLIQPPRTAKAKVPHKRQNYVFVAILAVAIIAVLAYLGWGNSSSPTPTLVTTSGMDTTPTATTPAVDPAPSPPPAPPTPTAPTPTTGTTAGDVIDSIVFQSTKSDNWIGIYKDANLSQQIWAGTLSPGESKQLGAADLGGVKTVYMQVGSVNGLGAQVNGQAQNLTGQKTYKVTAAGAKPVGS